MMRRRGGRGILGTMATTAVVAGTAGAVHHRQEQRYQNKAMQQQAQADAQAGITHLIPGRDATTWPPAGGAVQTDPVF